MTGLPELAEALRRGDPPETMWPILRELEPAPLLRSVDGDQLRKHAAENANTRAEYERLLNGLPVDGVA